MPAASGESKGYIFSQKEEQATDKTQHKYQEITSYRKMKCIPIISSK